MRVLIESARLRASIVTMLSAVVLGCGGNGDTVPLPPPLPMQGTWSLFGTMDGLATTQAQASGTLRFAEELGTRTLALTGEITLAIDGETFVFRNFQDVRVTPGGAVNFTVVEPGAVAAWTFTGALDRGTVRGRHRLGNTVNGFEGAFTLVRQVVLTP